jgi:hypothetical protein
MTWRPACYEPDELAAWDGVRPCGECLIAWQRDRLAEGRCNGTPNLPRMRGPGRHKGGRPVTSHSPRAVKRRARQGVMTISFIWPEHG